MGAVFRVEGQVPIVTLRDSFCQRDKIPLDTQRSTPYYPVLAPAVGAAKPCRGGGHTRGGLPDHLDGQRRTLFHLESLAISHACSAPFSLRPDAVYILLRHGEVKN